MIKLYNIIFDADGPCREVEENIRGECEYDAIFGSKTFVNRMSLDKITAELADISAMSRVALAVMFLPPAFQEMVRSVAYERGHSGGEEEVGVIAEGMVADLTPCIAAYDLANAR